MAGLMGNYEGEGTNVTATVPAQQVLPDQKQFNNSGSSVQGREASVAIDRRRRVRTSDEGARDAVAISYGSGDQTLAVYCRGVYITTAGNLAVRFVDGTADVTLTGLLAGNVYPFCLAIIRNSGSSAAGFILY